MSLFNLNEASQQSTGTTGAIPPDSCVVVRMHLRTASEVSTGRRNPAVQGSHPLLIKSGKSSLEYLDTVLEVVQGKYTGRKIFHKFNILGAQTEGQRKAVDISRAQIRALVEDARGIAPEDVSPQACQARNVEPDDLEGMTFPIMVRCEPSQTPNKAGTEYYCNNTLFRVIVASDPQWKELQEKGEMISDQPVPTYPVAGGVSAPESIPPFGGSSSAQANVTPSYFASQPTQTQPSEQRMPPPNRMPAWGQKTDSVPFN